MQLSKLPSHLYLKKNENYNGKSKQNSDEPILQFQASSRPSSGVTYPKLATSQKFGSSRIFIDASAGSTRISNNGVPTSVGKKLQSMNRFSPQRLNRQGHFFNWEDEKIKRL